MNDKKSLSFFINPKYGTTEEITEMVSESQKIDKMLRQLKTEAKEKHVFWKI